MYLTGLRLETQELRTEHRNEGEGSDSGDDHDDAGDPSELLEHDSGHTLDHGQRHEHGKHGQCGSDDGYTHLLGRMHGSFLRLCTTLKMRRDVLKHHNGIVDHHTDGYGQGGHRDNVQCVACSPEIHERCKERDRDRKDDDECGPPSSEEEINHEHHYEEGHQNGLLQGIESIENVVRAVHYSSDGDVGRQGLLDLLHFLLYAPDHIHCVGICLLLDDDLGTLGTIDKGLLISFLDTVHHSCHITQIDGLSVHMTHHDVKHLAGIGELLLHAESIGVGSYIDCS